GAQDDARRFAVDVGDDIAARTVRRVSPGEEIQMEPVDDEGLERKIEDLQVALVGVDERGAKIVSGELLHGSLLYRREPQGRRLRTIETFLHPSPISCIHDGKALPRDGMPSQWRFLMSSGTLRETVTNRLQQGFDAVYWMLIVHVPVIVFALAGGIVVGAPPAIIAGTELTRRRADGRLFPILRTFAQVWRAEFWRANGLLMPFGIAAGILVVDIAWFRANGPLGTAGILAIAALVIVATL